MARRMELQRWRPVKPAGGPFALEILGRGDWWRKSCGFASPDLAIRASCAAVMPAKRAYLYILRCADKSLYTGIARDIALRLAAHNAGKGAKYTSPRRPVRVVYREGPMSLTRALQREYQLKQLTRTQKLALIAGRLKVPRPR
jgi:putative endonuclease